MACLGNPGFYDFLPQVIHSQRPFCPHKLGFHLVTACALLQT